MQIDHQCFFQRLRIFIITGTDDLVTFSINRKGISTSLLILLNGISEQVIHCDRSRTHRYTWPFYPVSSKCHAISFQTASSKQNPPYSFSPRIMIYRTIGTHSTFDFLLSYNPCLFCGILLSSVTLLPYRVNEAQSSLEQSFPCKMSFLAFWLLRQGIYQPTLVPKTKSPEQR